MYSMGPQDKVQLHELAVFRINVPVAKLLKKGLRCLLVFYQVLQDKRLMMLDQIEIGFCSLLWLNSYLPVFSIKCGCAVDVTVQSQMLKVRIKNMK